MAHDVFISYASSDKAVADAVCSQLESVHRVRCWIAPRDIMPGASWAGSIIDALDASKTMVLIFSNHANASVQIEREVERAVHKGIIIIPLRIENAVPNKTLEYFISAPHWLDAMSDPLEQHIARLAASVKALIAKLPQSAPREPDRTSAPPTAASVSLPAIVQDVPHVPAETPTDPLSTRPAIVQAVFRAAAQAPGPEMAPVPPAVVAPPPPPPPAPAPAPVPVQAAAAVIPIPIPMPVEVAKPAEPVRPVEAAKAGDARQPHEVAKPTDVAKPAEIAKPAAEVVKPAEVAKPAAEIAKPAAEVAKPVAEVVKPAEVAKPADAAKPSPLGKPAATEPSKSGPVAVGPAAAKAPAKPAPAKGAGAKPSWLIPGAVGLAVLAFAAIIGVRYWSTPPVPAAETTETAPAASPEPEVQATTPVAGASSNTVPAATPAPAAAPATSATAQGTAPQNAAAAAGRGRGAAPSPKPNTEAPVAAEPNLFVDFQNSLSEGSVVLDVDGETKWSETLGAGLKGNALTAVKLKRSSETLGTSLNVPAGSHKLNVSLIKADGTPKDKKSIDVQVDGSEPHTLLIRLSRFKSDLQLSAVAGKPADPK